MVFADPGPELSPFIVTSSQQPFIVVAIAPYYLFLTCKPGRNALQSY
jgi:hypothetical protein